MKHKLLNLFSLFLAIFLMSSCGGNSLVGIYDIEVNKEYSESKAKLVEQDPELKYLMEEHMESFFNSFFGHYDGAEIIFNEDSTGRFNGEIVWTIIDDTLVVIRKSSSQWNEGVSEDISFRIKKLKGFNKIEFYYANLFKPGTDELIKYAFTITRNKEKEQKAKKREEKKAVKNETNLDKHFNTNSSNNISTKGGFSVAHEKKVLFSPGNLQYQASTKTWRFAEHQWDFVGTHTGWSGYMKGFVKLYFYGGTIEESDNANISETYDGWIDLFGWGTSGYNRKEPYMTSTKSEDYGDGENDIAGTNYDWGVYNAISNGGNKAWRTLTSGEWRYLLCKRPHWQDLHSWGCIDSINGMILLPDDWERPNDIVFTTYDYAGKTHFENLYSDDPSLWEMNVYTIEDWSKLEANGAVFLPAAGERTETCVDLAPRGRGSYWTSDYTTKMFFNFECRSPNWPEYGYVGCSVRLVQDVK